MLKLLFFYCYHYCCYFYDDDDDDGHSAEFPSDCIIYESVVRYFRHGRDYAELGGGGRGRAGSVQRAAAVTSKFKENLTGVAKGYVVCEMARRHGCRVGGAGRAAAAAGRQSARTRWLRSIPWRQRQVLGFLSVVDGGLQFDDDGVGGIGLAAGWHGDRRHGEDGIRREKELLLALHIRLLH